MTTASPGLNGARKHPIRLDRPARNFFDGALLGNGGMGVVVVTRPDAVMLHLGHNDIWDERIYENSPDLLGTFGELWSRIQEADRAPGGMDGDASLQELLAELRKPYAAPFPRPFPCGTVLLGLPRRYVEVLGHSLHIDEGRCEVHVLNDSRPETLEIFLDQKGDRLYLQWLDAAGQPSTSPVNRVRLIPDAAGLAPVDRTAAPSVAVGVISMTENNAMPEPHSLVESLEEAAYGLSFVRRLPARVDGAPAAEDHYVRLTAQTTQPLYQGDRAAWKGGRVDLNPLERRLASAEDGQPFRAVISLDHARRSCGGLQAIAADVPGPTQSERDEAALESRRDWHAYWSQSAVELAHDGLERMWYQNSYFTRCAIRAGHWSPGLYGPWCHGEIGTAWHGDYHMNYNTQQAYWGVLSANRPELHEPYFDLVDHLVRVGEAFARDFYQLPGSCIPHCAYPVPMTTSPAPSPPWGWELFETPWTVLQLWQHYEYFMDVDLLSGRVMSPMRQAIRFLIAFLNRSDVLARDWGDDKVHFWPIIVPEVYGLADGFTHNTDGLADIVFTRAALEGYLAATAQLATHSLLTDDDRELEVHVRDVLTRLPELPSIDTPDGPVLASVEGEDPDVVFNVPVTLFSVFPAMLDGLHSETRVRDQLVRTWRRQRLEGGNELVFAALQGARLGVLDIEAWYRQVDYCTLPNGTATDMLLESGGRYTDETPFDFMLRTGVWVENFSQTAVVDACLVQDAGGVVHLFPSWPTRLDASFFSLRVRGGVTVSAELRRGSVRSVRLTVDSSRTVALALTDPAEAWELPQGSNLDETGDVTVVSFEIRPGVEVTLSRCI